MVDYELKQLQALSQYSRMSGKTYISLLYKQLEDERDARIRLEKELEQLRKVSEEINANLIRIQEDQMNIRQIQAE